MLEARLKEAVTLKRLVDAIKELVTDANFACGEEGINLQAMDNSHVALVAVQLHSIGFVHYRCDHAISLGVNLASFAKVLKCARDDDQVTLTASDAADVLNLVYEAKTQDRISEYDIKLMDIDQETLGIPDTEYDAIITLSSSEFARICRDLQQLGESVRVEVSKEGVRFCSDGDAANGSILLKPAGDKVRSMAEVDKKAKKEKIKVEEDEDAQMADDNASEDDAGEKDEEEENDEGEESSSKKRKRSGKERPERKAKKARKDDEDEDAGVIIAMNQHVSLTFSLKYLANFAKSGSLSNRVSLSMSNEVPLLVSYDFGQGIIKYYLAPKIGDD